VGLELLATDDIVGQDTLDKLKRGETAQLRGSQGEDWTLKQLDATHVLALRSSEAEPRRSTLEWTLTLLFYAAIALVIMMWIWPLSRDVHRLERAVGKFGDRNWHFDTEIGPHSQIHRLALAFRRMAARIDGLIASHRDLSNAISHEIKTPLARMKFEIELAQHSDDTTALRHALGQIQSDVDAINELVTATLEYAILDRAEVALNISNYDFTTLLPAIANAVQHDTRPEVRLSCEIAADATAVRCDGRLIEATLKNLLYNAMRYARSEIRVSFLAQAGRNKLLVDDDGPGIPEHEWERIFDSFVQLENDSGKRAGFGFGLAIVRRVSEWHGGAASTCRSPLGGARFCVEWPERIADEGSRPR
jgi:signal transduction histidine kinase